MLACLRPIWFLFLGTSAVPWDTLIRVLTPLLTLWLALQIVHFLSLIISVYPGIPIILKLLALLVMVRLFGFLIRIGKSNK